jgi:hypothetical protein
MLSLYLNVSKLMWLVGQFMTEIDLLCKKTPTNLQRLVINLETTQPTPTRKH